MKKFDKKDVFINTIKTYPKVKIFSNSGRFFYNSEENGPKLNAFLYHLDKGIPDGAILLEDSDTLMTEDGDFIIIE